MGSWAALVKESYDGVLDTTDDIVASLEDTKAKRACLIPINAFSSTQIMKTATATGQSEDYKKFGADEETPSGVEAEDVRNSTHQTGSSLNLVLNDVSSIRVSDNNEEEIQFEELQNFDDVDIFQESNTDNPTIPDTNDYSDATSETVDFTYNQTTESNSETIDKDDIDFSEKSKPNLSKPLKATKRNVTVVENGETTFLFATVALIPQTNPEQPGINVGKYLNYHFLVRNVIKFVAIQEVCKDMLIPCTNRYGLSL